MATTSEIKGCGFKVSSVDTIVQCMEFEDNSGTLEIMILNKIRHRISHIKFVYHIFREHLKIFIHIFPIGTNGQFSDFWVIGVLLLRTAGLL